MFLKPNGTFFYEASGISFVAHANDIRSCISYRDDRSREWCCGVNVLDTYTKLRFDDEQGAKKFAQAIAEAKEDMAAVRAAKFAALAEDQRTA